MKWLRSWRRRAEEQLSWTSLWFQMNVGVRTPGGGPSQTKYACTQRAVCSPFIIFSSEWEFDSFRWLCYCLLVCVSTKHLWRDCGSMQVTGNGQMVRMNYNQSPIVDVLAKPAQLHQLNSSALSWLTVCYTVSCAQLDLNQQKQFNKIIIASIHSKQFYSS